MSLSSSSSHHCHHRCHRHHHVIVIIVIILVVIIVVILYHTYHSKLTMSQHYLVTLKIARKQPTAYCSTCYQTNCFDYSHTVVRCSFHSLFITKFFYQSSDSIFVHSHTFYQKFLFKLNTVNFNMLTKVKLT